MPLDQFDVFVLIFHVVCKISNFNMWTAKHFALSPYTKLTLPGVNFLFAAPRFWNLPTALPSLYRVSPIIFWSRSNKTPMPSILGREMASIKYQFDTFFPWKRNGKQSRPASESLSWSTKSTQSQFPTLVSVLSSFLSPLLPFFFKGLRKMLILPSNFWVFLKSKCGIFVQDKYSVLLSRINFSIIYINFV